MKPALRWIALVAVIGNVAFNYIYQNVLQVPSMKTVSDKYYNLFTPAGYAFAIWGLIYVSFIVYTIASVLPAQKNKPIYDELAVPLIIANMGGSVWITLFTADKILASELVILVMLASGIALFLRNNKAVLNGYNKMLTVPFSLFLGWIAVATIACTTAWLVSLGWKGGGISEALWAQIMLVVAGIVGVILALKYRNILAPLVIAWASVAIYMKQRNINDAVAFAALGIAGLMVLFALVALFSKRKRGA